MPPKTKSDLPTVAAMASRMTSAVRTPKKKKKYNAATLITAAIRRIWAWSPLRREALKRAKDGKHYHCEECGEITDKPEVHHDNQIILHSMSKAIAEKVFPPLHELTVVCPCCHLIKHRKDK